MIQDVPTAEVERPSVERTRHAGARNNAVGQRAAAMRAAVIDGDEGVAQIENGETAAGNFYRLSLAHGNTESQEYKDHESHRKENRGNDRGKPLAKNDKGERC